MIGCLLYNHCPMYKLPCKSHMKSFYIMDVPVEIRRLIVNYHMEGMSCRKIAETLHRPKSTVIDIVRRYKEGGIIQTLRVGRCGRPSLLSYRDERALVRESVANPRLTAREIQSNVGGIALNVSLNTVKRSLIRHGRCSYRPMKSPSLNSAQCKVRLQWCKRYETWDALKWSKVSHKSAA